MNAFKNKLAIGLTAGVTATVFAPFLVPAIKRSGRSLAGLLIMGSISLHNKGVRDGNRSGSANERRSDLISASESDDQQIGAADAIHDNLNLPSAQAYGAKRGM